jgi:hypothetical protein
MRLRKIDAAPSAPGWKECRLIAPEATMTVAMSSQKRRRSEPDRTWPGWANIAITNNATPQPHRTCVSGDCRPEAAGYIACGEAADHLQSS